MQSMPGPVTRLIDEFTKLPSIGPKTAQRLAFYLLRQPEEFARSLSEAINDVKVKIRYCSTCFNITESDPCLICADSTRDRAVICVVEEPLDIVAIERTRVYKGLYHVLHGAMDPLEGIGPDELKVRELMPRLTSNTVREVILATNPNILGEATAHWVENQIKRLNLADCKVTRLGRGLPAGGDIEYADDITLMRALESRRET